jgi:hypothetical protein
MTLALAVVAPSLISGAARAEDERRAEIVLGQQLVMLLNPMGAEHALDLAVRSPIGDQDDILFRGARSQVGVVSYVSPVYAITGGYFELAPLSFLVLRAEVTGTVLWPIGMDGAGYYGLTGYDADVRSQALPADAGGTATGWTATGSATLQGMLPIGPIRLLFADEVGLARAMLGSEPFHYSPKYDLVLAREDVLVTSSAFLGIELDAASDLIVRVGAYDDLRHVPASGYVGHQVGGLAMLEWARPASGVRSLGVFVRGGFYTHHVVREGEATILGGVALSYDLGGVR